MMSDYRYIPRKRRRQKFPWPILWLFLLLLVVLYFVTPWKVAVNSQFVAVPVVEGVQKNYESLLSIKVNKPGLVTVNLLQDSGTTATISHDVVFVWRQKDISVPFTIDKPSEIEADVSFFRTATSVNVAEGVSLSNVYLMGSYYQGSVNLYQRPKGYPTFKVVGTASANDGFFPLNMLKQYGLTVQQTGSTVAWDLDSQVSLTVDLGSKAVILKSKAYKDLSYAFPISGSVEMNSDGALKGDGVVLPMPVKVVMQLGATTFPQVSLVLHNGYFTIEDTPIENFTLIDQFATYLLDKATFGKDSRASALYQHVQALKLEIEDFSSAYSSQWLADRKDTERWLEQISASANPNVDGSKCSLITPIPNPIVTSGFGERLHPLLGVTVLHSGIDILAMAGYPARAAASGTVVYTGYRPQWGYYAVLKSSGCVTVYAHLLRLPEKKSYVQGEVLAYTGSSGFVTGPHLHFEVRLGGKPVDPRSFIGIK